jgi:HAD superfamily hydrolase (TIGR01490 family)
VKQFFERPPGEELAPSGGSEVREALSVGAKLALFDLDHTLIPIDSDYAWGQFTIELGWVDTEHFARSNDAFFAQYREGTLDIHAYVRFATQAIREQGATKSIAAMADFIRATAQKHLKPQALDLVQAHRLAGDEIVIVTATNEFVTRPIADAFGVEHLIAIELARDAAGELTGEIAGVPSFQGGKVTRVEAWLAERGLRLEDLDSTFYSDSMNDLPLLERVTHPVATNPDARLRALALERGWRILDLF